MWRNHFTQMQEKLIRQQQKKITTKIKKEILTSKGIKKAHSEELTGWLKNMQILIWEERCLYFDQHKGIASQSLF